MPSYISWLVYLIFLLEYIVIYQMLLNFLLNNNRIYIFIMKENIDFCKENGALNFICRHINLSLQQTTCRFSHAIFLMGYT